MLAERLRHPIFSARSQSLSEFKVDEDARVGSCHKPRNCTKHATKHITTKCLLPFLTPSHAGSLEAYEKKMEVKMEEIPAQPIRSHT